MVKSGICFGECKQTKCSFFKRCAQKNTPTPFICRIGPALMASLNILCSEPDKFKKKITEKN